MRTDLRLHRSRRRGLSLIEAALVLPLFILLLFGFLEYSWAFWKSQQIGNAARHGARLGIVDGATAAEVQAGVDQIMANSGLGGSGYLTTLTPGDPAGMLPGELFTVTVSVDYSNIILIGMPLLPVPNQLSRETGMAREGPRF